MSTENPRQVASRKYKVHKLLSALTFAIGLVLMIGKIYVDSEPGAIPLLLLVAAIGWYVIARHRSLT